MTVHHDPAESGFAADQIAQLEEKVAQLEHALQSRILIEQAKGILSERLAISIDEAFDILRYAARSHRTKLHEVAGRVVSERATPAPVVVAIARASRARAAWMRELAEAHAARVTELHAAMREQLERVEADRKRRSEKRA
jgi:cell division septum initiation protein DivIVA